MYHTWFYVKIYSVIKLFLHLNDDIKYRSTKFYFILFIYLIYY